MCVWGGVAFKLSCQLERDRYSYITIHFISCKADFKYKVAVYKRFPIENIRTDMLCAKRNYLESSKKAKIRYNNNEKHKVKNLAKHSPSAFWKYIKKQNNKNEVDGPSADEFIKHFSKLSTDLHVNHHEYADQDIEINELNCKITNDEVKIAIKCLDRGKSYGLDNLINEMFIDGIHVNIFNYIFESGTYPQEWLKGLIVPIPKKGDLTDAIIEALL